MKWYEKTWATILFLIFFFPVGLYLMWRYRNWNKVIKCIITGFFALCVLVNIATRGSNSGTATTANKETTKQEESADKKKDTSEEDTKAKEIAEKEAKYKPILESGKLYANMSDEEGNIATELVDNWDNLSDDFKTKYNSKKDTIKQSIADYYAKKAEEEEKKANVPTEYKSALKKAQVYVDNMYMSKAGLYDQLTSEYGEKFPAEAAQYAIDNVQADWKNNALKKAETYQNDMAMSKQAVYDQLVSDYGEKFTAEEAQYAIDNLK